MDFFAIEAKTQYLLAKDSGLLGASNDPMIAVRNNRYL